MTTCRECGLDRGEVVQHGPLRVTSDPPAAYWRGLKMPLQPAHVRILRVLARTGKASHDSLYTTVASGVADPAVVKAQIGTLRHRLPDSLQIETIRGWGYGLIIHEEPTMTDDAKAAPDPAAEIGSTPATMKTKLAGHIAVMPDDARAAMLIVADKDGKLSAFAPGVGVSGAVELLGLATASIGRRMVPVPA